MERVRDILRQMKSTMKPKNKKPTKAGKSAGASLRTSLGVKSILVPLDFSQPSKRALDYAVAVAQQLKAKLTLLHVVEPIVMPDFAASFPLAMENDKVMAAAEKELASVVEN